MINVMKKRFDAFDMLFCGLSSLVVSDYGLFSYQFFVFLLAVVLISLVGGSFLKRDAK